MFSLAVFLGNPGAEYARNRHNAGRLLAEKLPFYESLAWQNKFSGRFARAAARAAADGCDFLIPGTYMNLSGVSVQKAAAFHRIPPGGIIVVHDELELPLGTVSLKFAGGLGGHNGLRSIKEKLGTAEFWRLRIGIGRPPAGFDDVAGWVLSNFTPGEMPVLEAVLDAGVSLMLRALTEEPEQLLPEWKKKQVSR